MLVVCITTESTLTNSKCCMTGCEGVQDSTAAEINVLDLLFLCAKHQPLNKMYRQILVYKWVQWVKGHR